jgi:hypothetical protein
MTASLVAADLDVEIQLAAQRLYDAEIALHIAHQTGVDAWVKAAGDRLHDAVVAHRALDTARVTSFRCLPAGP